jgi:ketosteroid isomerase-like protein
VVENPPSGGILPATMNRISEDQVRAQVHKFWNILSGKSQESLDSFYMPEAIVFTGKARRVEPAPLAAARRTRQLSSTAADSAVELGAMDVQIVSDVAVVSYTYQFSSMMTGSDGKRLQRKTSYGRATQIFTVSENGALKIMHEHLSAGENPAVEKS